MKTLIELRQIKRIKISDIQKVVARQTYYNWIEWKSIPRNPKTINAFCELFEIDIVTFQKLLKNTIKFKS